MAKFQIIISDPETGQSQSIEMEGNRAVPLIGRKLGEVIDGSIVDMSGHELRLTGGSDKDGFPMRPSVHGGVRIRAMISGGTGFRSHKKGERKRKSLRGNVITEDIVQVNMKLVKKPQKEEKKAAKPVKKVV
ncbi:30S ribosomal protein S6e, partial [Candidatus Bathyarchaeota archaeon]|nr:30S ribosomal protein S6e [Candidatus Bathyarchaeota archaeon]